MKNKSVKMIISLAALGVLLGGYFGLKAYVSKQEAKEAEENSEEEKTNVFDTETDSIKSLKFTIDDQEVTFEKKDGTWVKKNETDFPVDQDTLDSAASCISCVNADRVLTDVEDLSGYGLDVPSNTITVTTDDASVTVLQIGIENSSTGQYYIYKDDDKDKVYVVSDSVVSPFMDSLYDYAEMGTFPLIDSSAVSKVEVEQDEKSYEAVKNADTGLWEIGNDDNEPEKADSSLMSSLTYGLSTLEYDTFVNYNCTDKSEYGLDDPYAVITVDYQEEVEEEDTDAEEASTSSKEAEESDNEASSDDTESSEEQNTVMIDRQITILVGNEADTESRYVMIEGSNEVYTMTTEILSTIIDKDVSSMWNMTVNYVSKDELESLDVNIDGEENVISVSRETVTVEKDESGETDDSDSEETETITTYTLNGEEIEDLHFSSFYNKLINMTAQKRLNEEFNPENDPELSVVFHKVDNESVNVDFYQYDVNYYAAVVDNNKIYLVNKMTYKELKNSFENLFEDELQESQDKESEDVQEE